MIVGGMPAVVQDYVRFPDLAACSPMQENILRLYRSDIARYAKSTEKNNIQAIFDSIPAQLDSKTSRFVLSRLKEGARMQRYENSFLWLREAGVSLPRFNVSAPVTPLTLNGKRSFFKLFLCDTGSLCEASPGNLQVPLLQGEVGINAGSLLENVFAQSIAAKDTVLCYYDQKKFGELDFVLQNGRQVDLLEIKSGSDWKKHPSLSKAIDSDQCPGFRLLQGKCGTGRIHPVSAFLHDHVLPAGKAAGDTSLETGNRCPPVIRARRAAT